jgi:transcriptional regulator with XRE-family HTH domain
VNSLGTLVRDARLTAGLSQRALAHRAGTSQPAVARYETGAASPSWETLQRLAEACGKQLHVSTEITLDREDIELARRQLELTPLQRLRALPRFSRLRSIAKEPGE